MKKKKKKSLIERIENKKIGAFTLIELLAVIIILGVLMIIAIPSVTEYIQTSRKNSYIVTAQSFIDAATTKVNSMEYDVMDVDATYYLPTKCISFEKGGDSPFGEFEESYVVITYDGKGYDYYYTGRDSSNHGIVLTFRELLDESFIETDTKTIDLTVGVGHREKIIRYTTDCNKSSYEEIPATKLIEEHGTLKDGSTKLDEVTSPSCFEFDSSTGTITGYTCTNNVNLNAKYDVINVDKCVDYLMDYGFAGTESEIRKYCSGSNDLEYTLVEDLNDGVVPRDIITEMLSEGIIKIVAAGTPIDSKNVIIPKSINGVTVKRIGDYAFYDTDIYTVVIPETIIEIQEHAFDENKFLYNIINKTGREFNWGSALGCRNSTFETGMTDLDCGCGRIYNMQVTSSRVDYNLEGMFSHDRQSLILLDSKGYDVYYKLSCGSDGWVKYEVNHELNCDTEFYAYNYSSTSQDNVIRLKNNYNQYNKKYSVQPVSCDCPDMEIKIEKNGTLYFAQHFDFRCK